MAQLQLKGKWYLHIPVSKTVEEFSKEEVTHVVGIDGGLRFFSVTYDEQSKTEFVRGKQILRKHHKFLEVRRQLQSKGTKSANSNLRSWSFYQLEQFLAYKAHSMQSEVLKVSAKYTSQRCPRCGSINKSHRHHNIHEYICQCGYRSNDDRVGAMNIQLLGTLWISGEERPHFEKVTTSD